MKGIPYRRHAVPNSFFTRLRLKDVNVFRAFVGMFVLVCMSICLVRPTAQTDRRFLTYEVSLNS